MNLNKAELIGRLTHDPEIKDIGNGTLVANFSMATNRFWTKDGQKQEATDFHRVVFFGVIVEKLIEPYLRKGALCYISGRMQTRSWDDPKSGEKRYMTEIVGEDIQLAPRSTQSDGGGDPRDTRPQRTASRPPARRSAPARDPGQEAFDNLPDFPDNDIPIINLDEDEDMTGQIPF